MAGVATLPASARTKHHSLDLWVSHGNILMQRAQAGFCVSSGLHHAVGSGGFCTTLQLEAQQGLKITHLLRICCGLWCLRLAIKTRRTSPSDSSEIKQAFDNESLWLRRTLKVELIAPNDSAV